ncbi:uncharacterized protein LOC131956954 [Physella acuta]|uniref:uncharacterized protein LOC131956954 n=1 Tax=Physella acuta TaxID=109671 RepID=UPI0027DAE4A1|nr:uncharacterized protein LOC131956954 [Physella acuta]
MSGRLASSSSVCSVAPFDSNDVPISVDLPDAAKFLLEFLSEISAKPELYEGPLVECAIQRYERYWLPLVAKHPGRLLPAPLDIEWIWQCHMLSPAAYNTDCHNIAGKLIDHHLMEKSQRKELLKDSERLWRKEYADVPFSACDAVTPWFDCEFVSALTYNLASAVARQRVFYYQVSLPHYRDDKFLQNALLRYKKFLFLKCHNPGVFLVPCYDNDLMWHTHMLHPVFYKDDTETYMGSLLPHDDSVNDRTIGSKLSLSEAKTRNLWRKVFSEKFSYFGAMYRGEPPNSKLYAMNKEDICRVCTKQANILIEKIGISGLPLGKTFKLKLCYNTGYQNFNRSLFVTENIATVKGTARVLEDNRVNTHFSFDTRYNDKIILSLQQKSGKLCLGTNDIVGEGKIDLQKKIQSLNSKGLTANDEIDCGDGLSIGLNWSCPAPVLGPCVLRLEQGEYQSCVMPEDRESIWGPIPLPRLPPGVDNRCSVASHKLFNHTRRVVFTVRMIHSEPLLMSAIHVFYGDKLTVVAHLVVGDQLPLPSSVTDTKKCVTLNPKEGQRAVLIKNNNGDWGVAVGWWDGFQRRLTGRKGSGSEGHLEVRFYHLKSNKCHFVSFDRLYSLATSKFEIGDSVVEFDSGFIEINSDRSEIAENLGLIFSVALIHVLCQPRPTNWAPQLTSPKAEEQAVPRLGGSEEIALLLAAGVLIATPCNHAIKNLFKRRKQEYGENMLRSGQREQGERSEMPSLILHEAQVNAGWAEDNSNAGASTPEAAVCPSSALTVIKESDDESSEEDVKTGHVTCESDIEEVTEETCLLRVTDDTSLHQTEQESPAPAAFSNEQKNDNREVPVALYTGGKTKYKETPVAVIVPDQKELRENPVAVTVPDKKELKESPVGHGLKEKKSSREGPIAVAVAERAEYMEAPVEVGTEDCILEESSESGEEDISERESEGVFDADSQTGLFGNGESDSDEVEDEDPFGHASPNDCGEESSYVMSSHEEIAFDVDNYYDEFYNIGSDDQVNGCSNENIGGLFNDVNHLETNAWEVYSERANHMDYSERANHTDYSERANHTDYAGFVNSYGSYNDHEDTGVNAGLFGGGGDCEAIQDHSTMLYCAGGGDHSVGGGEISGGLVDSGGDLGECGGCGA